MTHPLLSIATFCVLAASLAVGAQTVTLTPQKTDFDSPMFTSSELVFTPNTTPTLYGWFNRLDWYKPTTQAEVDQIGRDAAAGRAESQLLLSRLLERLPDGKEDCAAILRLLQKGKALGSARADYQIGTFYAQKECGEGHQELAIPALLEAVKRDNTFAALDLSKLFSQGPRKNRDPLLAYVYAQYAEERLATILPEKLTPDLQPRTGELRAALSRKQLEKAAALLVDLNKTAAAHQARLANSMSVRILGNGESAPQPPGWSVLFWQIDHTGECFDNLIGNCKGVPRLIAGRLTNKAATPLMCTLRVKLPEFAGGDAMNASYTLLAAPNSRRAIRFGESPSEVPNAGAFSANCAPVTLDAKSVCAAVMAADSDASGFYPVGLVAQGSSGTTLVHALAIENGKPPADVAVAKTSGNRQLDLAAMAAVRSRLFSRSCNDKFGIGTVSVTFAGR